MILRFFLLIYFLIPATIASPLSRINELNYNILASSANHHELSTELLVLCVTGHDFRPTEQKESSMGILTRGKTAHSLNIGATPATSEQKTTILQGLTIAAYNLQKVDCEDKAVDSFFENLLTREISFCQKTHIKLARAAFWNAWGYFSKEEEPEWENRPIQQTMNDLRGFWSFRDLLNNTQQVKTNTAVIDTGFAVSNSLLKGYITKRYDPETKSNNIAPRKRDGTIDNHGTHVAGIVIQYNPNNDIHAIKLRDPGDFISLHPETLRDYTEQLIATLTYAATLSYIKVVNLSFHFTYDNARIIEATRKLVNSGTGKLFVIAAGNYKRVIGNDSWTKGLADLAANPLMKKRIIIVGAHDSNRNSLADFSNRAGTASDYYICGPGINVLSAMAQRTGISEVEELSGTSMATPAVTGILSFLIQMYHLTVDQARELIFKTARSLGDPLKYGKGEIDRLAAKKEALKLSNTR